MRNIIAIPSLTLILFFSVTFQVQGQSANVNLEALSNDQKILLLLDLLQQLTALQSMIATINTGSTDSGETSVVDSLNEVADSLNNGHRSSGEDFESVTFVSRYANEPGWKSGWVGIETIIEAGEEDLYLENSIGYDVDHLSGDRNMYPGIEYVIKDRDFNIVPESDFDELSPQFDTNADITDNGYFSIPKGESRAFEFSVQIDPRYDESYILELTRFNFDTDESWPKNRPYQAEFTSDWITFPEGTAAAVWDE